MLDKDTSESLYLCLQLPMEQVKMVPVLVQWWPHLLILVSCSHINSTHCTIDVYISCSFVYLCA